MCSTQLFVFILYMPKVLYPVRIYTRLITKVHAMKAYRGSKDTAPLFITSALDRLVNFTPQSLYSRKEARYPLIGGWVNPRAGLEFLGESTLAPTGFEPCSIQAVS